MHRDASLKFAFLWVASLLPLAIAALTYEADNSSDAGHLLAQLWNNFTTEFSTTHQFVYAVSFLTPMLYLIYERYVHLERFVISGKRSKRDVSTLPSGYFVIAWIAFGLYIFTAAVYGAGSTDESITSKTLLGVLAYKFSGVVYAFAMFCWYIAILDADGNLKIDFIEERRESTKKVTDGLKKRIEEASNNE